MYVSVEEDQDQRRSRARVTRMLQRVLHTRDSCSYYILYSKHNALRTIVGISLSGLEWFIHVDQLFSTNGVDRSIVLWNDPSGFHCPFLSFSLILFLKGQKRQSQLGTIV